jgi:hypothetical protein
MRSSLRRRVGLARERIPTFNEASLLLFGLIYARLLAPIRMLMSKREARLVPVGFQKPRFYSRLSP